MTQQSSTLGSFDPFATHPFTNNSGIIPDTPRPSLYPMQFSSTRQPQSHYPQYCPTSQSSSGASTPSNGPHSPLYSPQPQRGSAASKPIFVPFHRGDASSPELILKKKVAYGVGK
ncbi:hypothetical protein FA15DRAFT_701998 [Coprinopsis marcescibilis]|uniref:Uncharacterized protein n=1 Tax=Coprinopsis marcescibilis TaxID=230819 RepID=A0A5C3L5H9_COPMA|nr:hypothetical protein FA15DRAFT_701998 [Coprinopsis marcescibilis]